MAGTNKRYVQAKAKSWTLGVSSTGKEQVAVSFVVDADTETERFLAWYGYFTDATAERTIEALRFMGFEGDDLTRLEGLDKNTVELVLEDEVYEGQIREKVQWVNRGGGALVKTPLVGDKASAFAASMKEKFKTYDASNGKRAAKPAAARPAPPSGPLGGDPPTDDIPF